MCKFSDKRPTDQNVFVRKTVIRCCQVFKKKGHRKVKRHPKGALVCYHKHPLVFFTGFECESRQLWGDAGSKSCPSGNVREGLSDGVALKSMRARIMWLISPVLALRSEGADQSPAERAFSFHTKTRWRIRFRALVLAHKADSCGLPPSELRFSA